MSLSIAGLWKEYPTRGEPLVVLRGIDLTLERGEALAIMGPSGSGKSTLLHLAGTLDRPTRGTVTLDGSDPFKLDDAGLARFRNRSVGFVFQDHHLLPQCDVLENVLVPTLVDRTGDRAKLEARAKELLDRVGLSGRLKHRPAELSGGERQRVAVARALIESPPLLLADEPTGNLDSRHAGEIGRLLIELQKQEGMMLLLVTHSAELAAMFPKRRDMLDGQLVGGASS